MIVKNTIYKCKQLPLLVSFDFLLNIIKIL